MSELIQKHDNRATIRWKLLTGASAAALLASAYCSGEALAAGNDSDRPTVWIDLDGQWAQETGQGDAYIPDFVTKNLSSPALQGFNLKSLNPASSGVDMGGALTFQPENSDWVFSAAIRYGRANRTKTSRQITPGETYRSKVLYLTSGYAIRCCRYYTGHNQFHHAYADLESESHQKHMVLDFSAGKDVGLGLFGSGSSVVSAGLRFAQFSSRSRATLHMRPRRDYEKEPHYYFGYYFYYNTPLPSDRYGLTNESAREFRGVGPSISWNASAALAGNTQNGELTLDWGANAALLFGKQRASGSHHTSTIYVKSLFGYPTQFKSGSFDRKRNVVVPNLGGFAGLSFRYADAKIGLGYRGDFFFGAMDVGNDARKTGTTGFYGPFASISIGLGD